jgi:hypothetical protein
LDQHTQRIFHIVYGRGQYGGEINFRMFHDLGFPSEGES